MRGINRMSMEDSIGIFTALHPWVMWTFGVLGLALIGWGIWLAAQP